VIDHPLRRVDLPSRRSQLIEQLVAFLPACVKLRFQPIILRLQPYAFLPRCVQLLEQTRHPCQLLEQIRQPADEKGTAAARDSKGRRRPRDLDRWQLRTVRLTVHSVAVTVSPDEAEQGQSTVPRMVGEAEGVAVVNRR
jgi:hypothetical protein